MQFSQTSLTTSKKMMHWKKKRRKSSSSHSQNNVVFSSLHLNQFVNVDSIRMKNTYLNEKCLQFLNMMNAWFDVEIINIDLNVLTTQKLLIVEKQKKHETFFVVDAKKTKMIAKNYTSIFVKSHRFYFINLSSHIYFQFIMWTSL